MRNSMMRSITAAAALAVAAGCASAQTYTANIPMTFHAGDKVMAPGSYRFDVVNRFSGTGYPVIAIRSVRSYTAVMLMTAPGSGAPKAWVAEGKLVVSFECLGSDCILRQLWNGRDPDALRFPGRKLTPAEAERAASITVKVAKTQ
jgi:hypothetical protein